MPDILEHVAYLSQEIGPRPAGTEEEQQAALYITEQMQKEAGLSAVIDDFSGTHAADLPRVICCGATIVVTVLALFLPMVAVAAIVVTLIAAALFAAEVFNHPLLSRAFARGVSQNVVARYEPGYSTETGGSRRRKVVVVSRYDSGKVSAELNSPLLPILHILQWATFGGMVFVPLLLIVRYVMMPNAEGGAVIFLCVLAAIALVLSALPPLFALLHKMASYNEAANCNAAGTAVMLEVARRVGCGRVSEAELAAAEEASIHGEEAAWEAGLVPEGANLVYETEPVKPPEQAPQTPEARLAAAKAAVAALSGKPVTGISASDIAQNLVQIKNPPLPLPTDEGLREVRDETRDALSAIPDETMQEALANAEAQAAVSEAEIAAYEQDAVMPPAPLVAAVPAAGLSQPSDDVPDWFKKAQEKAKKQPQENKPVQRSRYASALDAAVSESSNHFDEANQIVGHRLEDALDANREEIHEIKAPQCADEASTSESVQTDENLVSKEATELSTGKDVAAEESIESPGDPFSTTAMPPIDVSELRRGVTAPIKDIAMPAFLDPLKVQQEVRAAQPEEQRTGNRIDVTGEPVDGSGSVGLYPEPRDEVVAEIDQKPEATTQRPIALPHIGITGTNLAPISELSKQRAPLADVEEAGKSAAKSLLTMLPSISVGEAGGSEVGAKEAAPSDPTATAKQRSLRSVLPSMSGSISREDIAEGKTSSVSAAGAFVPAGATGTFAPIGDELLENVDPDDIYVDDADDSVYEQGFTETGALAGPGYVEMPKSRASRLFDRFRRKKKDKESSAQEWLEVDESFDARAIGADRGGWESFRDEDIDGDAPTQQNLNKLNFKEDSRDGSNDDIFDDSYNYDEGDDKKNGPEKRRPWNGGAYSPRRMEKAELDPQTLPYDDLELSEYDDPDVSSELEQIYQFRNPDINTEVWFVALGSELAHNGGMRAFLTEHQQELRGSIIIDLDALGAGDLCMVEQEGMYRTVKTSSRMKRYTKKASQATGLSVGSAQIKWKESAASYAIKHGYQAMHLVGMTGGKPAFFAQGNDVLENIDEQTLEENTEFVMQLLKNI